MCDFWNDLYIIHEAANFFPEEPFLLALLKRGKTNIGFPLAGTQRTGERRDEEGGERGNSTVDAEQKGCSLFQAGNSLKLRDQSRDPTNVTHLIKSRNKRVSRATEGNQRREFPR